MHAIMILVQAVSGLIEGVTEWPKSMESAKQGRATVLTRQLGCLAK